MNFRSSRRPVKNYLVYINKKLFLRFRKIFFVLHLCYSLNTPIVFKCTSALAEDKHSFIKTTAIDAITMKIFFFVLSLRDSNFYESRVPLARLSCVYLYGIGGKIDFNYTIYIYLFIKYII